MRSLKIITMSHSHFFAFFTGALIGAIIALLLAPDKGSETRKKIDDLLKEKGINLSSDKLDEFIQKMKEHFNINNEENVIIDTDSDNTAK